MKTNDILNQKENKMKKQQGSVHIILIGAVVAMLVAALGFIFWQNFIQKPDASENNNSNISETTDITEKATEAVKEETTLKPAEQGTIVGSLTYPSEGIPPTMEIHATNLATNKDFLTTEQLSGNNYTYGVGYKLSVPAGAYHVYGVLSDSPDQRHYYINLVDKCDGQYDGCMDAESKVVVTVEPGKETKDIMAGWSMACLVPGAKQPTEKFDLPSC